MQAYLVSLHNLVPDPHQQALRDTQKTLQKSLIPCNSAECPNAAPAGTAQVCAGRFDMTPKVTYPQSLLQRFEVGALLLALDTNDRGDVVEVRILASVPADGLEATVIPTVKKWRFVKAPKQRVDVCTLAQKNRMLTLEFMLGH
jgi:TonB family protein